MGGVAKCFTLYWWYWCKFMVPVTVNKWVLWCYQKSWKKFHQSHLWVTGKRSPSHYHYARLEKNIHQHKTQISVVLWPRLGRLQAGRRKTVQEPFTETDPLLYERKARECGSVEAKGGSLGASIQLGPMVSRRGQGVGTWPLVLAACLSPGQRG